MAFRITAEKNGYTHSNSRLQPADASVVAKRWQHEGFDNVRITDPAGQRHDIESFRRRKDERRDVDRAL